jgi:hypothetical protein
MNAPPYWPNWDRLRFGDDAPEVLAGMAHRLTFEANGESALLVAAWAVNRWIDLLESQPNA